MPSRSFPRREPCVHGHVVAFRAAKFISGRSRGRLADRDSRTVPQAVRHRDELPPTAAIADLDLHAAAPAAAAVHRRGAVLAQLVGVDEILSIVVDEEYQAASCWDLIPSMN